MSQLLNELSFIVVALALYQLLKSVNKNMAALMVIFWLVGVPIAMLNEINHVAVLFLLEDRTNLPAFTPDQVHTLVGLFLNLHSAGLSITAIFWGLWLFPLGYLVFKSNFLPRFIGVLLMVGCWGYPIQSLVSLLFPTLDANLVLFLVGWNCFYPCGC